MEAAMWWWNGDGYGFGPWLLEPFMPIFWLLVIGAVIYFSARGIPDRESPSARSLEILKERFAHGEITQAQYEEQRRLLEA
jgi:uncharacterized membrane protein